MAEFMSYRILEAEREGLRSRLAKRRGTTLADTAYKVGDRVAYRGVTYTLLDHMADGASSTPVLLSDRWDCLHGVAWSDLTRSTV